MDDVLVIGDDPPRFAPRLYAALIVMVVVLLNAAPRPVPARKRDRPAPASPPVIAVDYPPPGEAPPRVVPPRPAANPADPAPVGLSHPHLVVTWMVAHRTLRNRSSGG